MITKPEDFHLQVGDIVHHIKEQEKGAEGVITHIDFDSYFFNEYSVTTCLVLWNGCREVDVQWSNKLVKQEKPFLGGLKAGDHEKLENRN